ncbi:hypothetical protein [Cryptosporangium minutisporangium]|uniref:Secreted protein n=1 Tax=Cryptosporangium minutisporangium TaxID=113569 RepID=A0ABP6SY00_9ACTN
MKKIIAIGAISIGLVGVAGPAEADRPPTTSGTFVLPGTTSAGANGYCPFDVRIDFTSRQRVRETTEPDGTKVTKATGNATATVTNVSTGKTLRYNISGPGTTTTHPDGAFEGDLTGANLLSTTVANSYSGVPQLAYTTGRVRFSVAASGLTTSYQLNGRSTDVCAALS